MHISTYKTSENIVFLWPFFVRPSCICLSVIPLCFRRGLRCTTPALKQKLKLFFTAQSQNPLNRIKIKLCKFSKCTVHENTGPTYFDINCEFLLHSNHFNFIACTHFVDILTQCWSVYLEISYCGSDDKNTHNNLLSYRTVNMVMMISVKNVSGKLVKPPANRTVCTKTHYSLNNIKIILSRWT